MSTSAHQIEGVAELRERSVWDDFADLPGRIKDGSTAAVARDHEGLPGGSGRRKATSPHRRR